MLQKAEESNLFAPFVHSLFCLRPVNSKLELTRLWDHLEAMCKKVCVIALTAEV